MRGLGFGGVAALSGRSIDAQLRDAVAAKERGGRIIAARANAQEGRLRRNSVGITHGCAPHELAESVIVILHHCLPMGTPWTAKHSLKA